MNTSVRWINDYLEPPATSAEQADALTRAGFPVESFDEVRLPSGETDTRLDVELTSNRGDCLCHVGLAKEIAAVTGRSLKLPARVAHPKGENAASLIQVENREPTKCPLYTARIIRGVKVQPSPQWLQERLLARGDTPRNNIVDASNYVLFELGQPTHVFDLSKIRGSTIVVRTAQPGERFLPIGEGAAAVSLHGDDLVIADAEGVVGIAGVKGGAESAVTAKTTDILIEAASFAPAAVRASARRHGIHSDAAYRFERGVSPGQVNQAAERLTDLIVELAGGTVCEGVASDGVAIPPSNSIDMRCDRCRAIIGLPVSDDRMRDMLDRLGLSPVLSGGVIHCEIPANRRDLEREIDIVEEVARLNGLDDIPVSPTVAVRVTRAEPSDLARRAVNDALAGMGFVETVTHSLIGEPLAQAFCPPGMKLLTIEDQRAGGESILRPSILPSLLRVLARNRDGGVHNVRLFETASVFASMNGQHVERVNLAVIAPGDHESLREVRGAIDRLAMVIWGRQHKIVAEPQQVMPWFAPGAVLKVGKDVLGLCGVLSPAITRQFGVEGLVVGAEIGLPQYYHQYPPAIEASPLPEFPSIERDLSPIVDDHVPWSAVREAIDALRLEQCEAVEFVTVFRGKQVGPGRKSLTLRLRFRATDRTLTHEEIDPQVRRVMDMLAATFKAEIRT